MEKVRKQGYKMEGLWVLGLFKVVGEVTVFEEAKDVAPGWIHLNEL